MITVNGQGISAQPTVYSNSSNIEVEKLSDLTDNKLNAKTNIYNFTSDDLKVWFLTVLYKENILVGTIRNTYTVPNNQAITVENSIVLASNLAGYTVKSMVWGENLNPLVISSIMK